MAIRAAISLLVGQNRYLDLATWTLATTGFMQASNVMLMSQQRALCETSTLQLAGQYGSIKASFTLRKKGLDRVLTTAEY